MENPSSAMSPSQAYHFLCSAVAPRPIAWVTSVGDGGLVNAAPFSWFQAVCADPPMVMIAVADRSDGGLKDTARNILASGEFVVNIARGEQLESLVATSAPVGAEVSEVGLVGLETDASQSVAPPRIRGCAASLECKLVESHRYGREHATTLLIGEVVHVAADDALLDARGNLDPVAAGLSARLGGRDYLRTRSVFQVERPL